MSRLLLAISLCLGTGLAFAAEPQVDPDAPEQECPRTTAKAAAAAHANSAPKTARPATTPATQSRNGGGGAPRVVSPRWHVMLPGMFR
jgi:hypothetical protein